MYRELLDSSIGPTPPTGVDVDRIILRERQRGRRRLAAPLVAGAGATVLLTACALWLGGPAGNTVGSAGGPMPVTAPPSTVPAPLPSPTPPSYPPFAGVPPTEPVPAAQARLRAAMRHAMSVVAPDAVLTGTPGHPTFWISHTDTATGSTASGSTIPSGGGPGSGMPSPPPVFAYRGNATVSRDGTTAVLSIEVGRAGPVRESCDAARSGMSCRAVTGPRGETGYLASQVLVDGESGQVEPQCHLWLNRTVDHGYVMIDLWTGGPAGTSPRLPLSGDQLIKIAEDPALTLYP